MHEKCRGNTHPHFTLWFFIKKKRENILYITEHGELYKGNIKEQIYVSRILK